MRILLFGKNGQVGWELQRSLAPLGELLAVDIPEIDFQDLHRLRTFTLDVRPHLIVNAAAFTAVDKAEFEPDVAMTINGKAPGVLAEAAKEINAGLVHYSTDYVFDGTKENPYTEDDSPNPLSVYGTSKLAGDNAIRDVDGAHLILRTSWVYGGRGKNFFLTMLKMAREKEEISVVDDQIGCPTWSRSIAEVTAKVLNVGYRAEAERLAWDEEIPSGVYNYSSDGSTSWYEFAKEIFRTDPLQHEHVLRKITPISSEEFDAAAIRPNYTQLSKSKIESVFGVSLENWIDQLRQCWNSMSKFD